MAPAPPAFTVALLGTQGAGKSTLCGHTLHKCGAVGKAALVDNEQAAFEFGCEDNKWRLLSDTTRVERERGTTLLTHAHKLATNTRLYTLLDLPTHCNLGKPAIAGVGSADGAALVVSAVPAELKESTTPDSVALREQIGLLYAFGIRQLVVVVNKMDHPQVSWSEEKFTEAKNEISVLLKKYFNPEKLQIIPASGLTGDNVQLKSGNMTWWKGASFVEALQAFTVPDRAVDKPLRLCVERLAGGGGGSADSVVAIGQVAAGGVQAGAGVRVFPGGFAARVASIQCHGEDRAAASAGDYVGLCLEGVQGRVHAGCMVVGEGGPGDAVEVRAQLIVLAPGGLAVGAAPVAHVLAAAVPCRVVAVNAKIDKRSGKATAEYPACLAAGEAGIVTLAPAHPLCCEPPARIALQVGDRLAAFGVVKEVVAAACK